jgi:signal transduction histidine kinase
MIPSNFKLLPSPGKKIFHFFLIMSQSRTANLTAGLCLFLISAGLHHVHATEKFTANDSINRILQALPDSQKITRLLDLSRQYQAGSITESLEFAKEALTLASSAGDTGMIATAKMRVAELYLLKGVYDKSLALLLEALDQFEQTGMEKETAYCCEVIGKIYTATGNPQQAIPYHSKAAFINKKLNHIPDVARNYTCMGSALVNMDSIDKGLTYYLVSFMIIDSLGMESEKNDLLIQIGNGYLKLGKYEESLKNYYQAMELAEKNGNLFLLSQAKSRIGIAYFRMNNLPAALKYSRESLILADSINTFRIAGESYKNLSEIYAAQQNYKKALDFYIRYKEASDSLLNEEKILQMGELQAKYDIAQKEKENEVLKTQNLHKSLTIKRLAFASAIIVLLLILSLMQLMMVIRLNKKTRKLNLKLAEQGKELEELNDQKDKFFSFVAHNLKNPFTTIMGFSELMVKGNDAKEYEKTDRYAKHILGLSAHVHKILENLLEWSRLQRRSFTYKPEKTNMTGLIRDVLEMNQKEAARKEIDIRYDLPEDLTAYADKFMVTTILQNLMSNALNFTPSSGKIHVTGRLQGSQVFVSVADNGIGIAPEDLGKLFRIDVHPAKIGTAESSGSGLGLVICKEMIQRCRGEISIDSSLSRGTTVTFTLPVTNGDSAVSEAGEITPPDFVLLIKDDMNNLGKLPEPFVRLYNISLLPKYDEVRSVLSLDHLSDFAHEVESAGQTYNLTSFVQFGRHLALLIQTHQVDKILRVLPEFKKMTDIFKNK